MFRGFRNFICFDPLISLFIHSVIHLFIYSFIFIHNPTVSIRLPNINSRARTHTHPRNHKYVHTESRKDSISYMDVSHVPVPLALRSVGFYCVVLCCVLLCYVMSCYTFAFILLTFTWFMITSLFVGWTVKWTVNDSVVQIWIMCAIIFETLWSEWVMWNGSRSKKFRI